MSELPKLEYQRDDFSPKPKLNALGTPTPPSPEPPREREGETTTVCPSCGGASLYAPDSYGDCERCDGTGEVEPYVPAASLPPSAGSGETELADEEDADLTHHWALEVLCRVFDDIEVAMDEWEAFYQPGQWLSPARALGAFIRRRLAAHPAGPTRAEEWE